jgi:pSer/pThr/pTyr-binding forkhead associated (FHA) protein
MAYLIVSQAGHELKRIELCKSPVVIGRSPECDLALHDILLSRRHCRLTPTTDGWLLIDLASRNGTRVGDRKIEQRFLKDADHFSRRRICPCAQNIKATTATDTDRPG